MTPTQFTQARERLGHTREEMSQQLQVTLRTIQLWEAGHRAIPGPAIVALRLMEHGDKEVQAELKRLRKMERTFIQVKRVID